jgi:hypothetical protein
LGAVYGGSRRAAIRNETVAAAQVLWKQAANSTGPAFSAG